MKRIMLIALALAGLASGQQVTLTVDQLAGSAGSLSAFMVGGSTCPPGMEAVCIEPAALVVWVFTRAAGEVTASVVYRLDGVEQSMSVRLPAGAQGQVWVLPVGAVFEFVEVEAVAAPVAAKSRRRSWL